MAGLGEILQENATMRMQLEAAEKEMLSMTAKFEAMLQVKEQALVLKEQALELSNAQVSALREKAEEMAQQLALLRAEHTSPKSQRNVPDEQELLPFNTDIVQPTRLPQEKDTESTPASDKKKKRRGTPKRRSRDSLKHLLSRKVICPADKEAKCVGCGGDLSVIGQTKSYRVEWVPGHFIVEDIIRDKCACRSCPNEGVLTVPGPYFLDRSLCGNALLSRVLVDKFSDHLPLNRQAKRMNREGLQITSNTLASWVLKSANLLETIAKSVQQSLMRGSFLQGDDTGFPVQDAGNGALRKGRLWAFTDQTQVFYAFTETKEGKYPEQLLDKYEGELLLADGGAEFNQVVKTLDLKRSGGWSHLRTYFFKAYEAHPAEVRLGLGTICDLFMLEREFHGKPVEEIVRLRGEKSRPLVDGFFEWVHAISTYVRAISTYVRPKSLLGKAVTYAINQEQRMRLFLAHGELPLHNNLSELMLRQAVVGRKNWLFVGLPSARSEGGATAAATMYTLIGSCMLQGLDPQAYLTDVMGRLLEHPGNRVSELTPAEWVPKK